MLGDIRLRDMTVQKLQTAYNKLTEVISPNTVHKLHVVVSGALEDAEVAGLIPYNYAARVKLPKKKRFEGTAYNKAQVKTLLAAAEEAGEPIRSAVVLGAIYGLRKSEACGLRWKDIDFEQGTMYIRNTVKTNGSLIVEEERTKTKKSRRMIALIPFTVPYFKELKETQERLSEAEAKAAKAAADKTRYGEELATYEAEALERKDAGVRAAELEGVIKGLGEKLERAKGLRKDVETVLETEKQWVEEKAQ